MLTVYKCEKCNKKFTTKEECEAHENSHESRDEFMKTNPHKYSIGDVVIVKTATIDRLTTIDSFMLEMQDDGRWTWRYSVGYDDYCHVCYVDECDIKKVVISSEDIDKKLIPEMNSVLKKYSDDIELVRDESNSFLISKKENEH